MLQYIFGLPKSGKTTLIIEKVKSLSDNNKKSVIIVPEQASFETEKKLYKELGDSFAVNVEILSFSRLYDEITRTTGGIAARNLNDSDKIILMSKTLKSVSKELKLWNKYVNSLTFAQKMLDAIGEFKINGISADDLLNVIYTSDSENLKKKLKDLVLIYENYDLFVGEKFIDPADKLTKLFYKLEGNNFFNNKTVFFDGFKGFTGQQYKIIDRIISSAKNVYFSFTNDNTTFKDYDVFYNIRATVNKINQIAKKHSLSFEKPIELSKSYYNSSSISLIERLASENIVNGDCNDSVGICKAKNIYDEAEFTARTIRKLVRTEKYRYNDFAIITRDSDTYSQAIEHACKKNKVNCFFDRKFSLLSFPLAVCILSAIKALNFNTENIFRFHKSGIGILSTSEIAELENYTYIWKIDGKIWLNEWDMDVRGLVNDEKHTNDELKLKNINSLRRRAIEPILFFKQNFYGDVGQMSQAIIKLLENCSADKMLKNLLTKFSNDTFSKDVIKQSYDKFINVLDSIVTCYGKSSLTTSEYYETLRLAFSLEDVGLIPQTLDQVIFGQADRIRPNNPKIVFILGANQGLFPKFSTNNSIFAAKERKTLIEFGLNVSDNELYSSIDENFLVYCNLSCPTDKLYICYSEETLNSQPLEPSAFVTNIIKKLNPKIFYEPSENLNNDSLPETDQSTFSELCKRKGDSEDFFTLKNALKNNIRIDFYESSKNSLTYNTATSLYGKSLRMSATKFDTFNRCEFSFFCKYGLKLNKLQPAEFNVLQRGTIVHYVLEKIISNYKENIVALSKNELNLLCDKYITEFLDSVIGYRTIETARHKFIVSIISRSLKEVLHHIAEEFTQSKFKPTDCELSIGTNNGLNLSFPFDDGEVLLEGKIDRVDKYNGFVRVVDYKTGTKIFKLPDILYGLNLQMLIYLYAITRASGLPDNSAAGIFYMPANRDTSNKGLAMNGLMTADFDLVCAMEKENNGDYIPQFKLTKSGVLPKNASSFIEENGFTKIFDHIEKIITKTGSLILNGNIRINPTDGRDSKACEYCDYKSICGIEDKEVFKVPKCDNFEVMEMLDKENEYGI